MVDWSEQRPAGQSPGKPSVNQLIGWSAGWLSGWSIVGRPNSRAAGQLVSLSLSWAIGQPVVWVAGWLVGRLGAACWSLGFPCLSVGMSVAWLPIWLAGQSVRTETGWPITWQAAGQLINWLAGWSTGWPIIGRPNGQQGRLQPRHHCHRRCCCRQSSLSSSPSKSPPLLARNASDIQPQDGCCVKK